MSTIYESMSSCTEETWGSDIQVAPISSDCATPRQGRIAQFIASMAASMALLRASRSLPRQSQGMIMPVDRLAQDYPYLHLRVMCGS